MTVTENAKKVIQIVVLGSKMLQQEISRLWPKNCSVAPCDLESANIVVFDYWGEFQEAYAKDNNAQYFVVISADEPEGLPKNVRWLHDMGYDIPLRKLMFELDGKKEEIKFGTLFFHPKEFSKKSKRILVIDSDKENLHRALDCFGREHSVALVTNHDAAMKFIAHNRCQVVVQAESAVDKETTFLLLYAARKGAHWIFASKPDDVFHDTVHSYSVNGRSVFCVDYTKEKNWELIVRALEEL